MFGDSAFLDELADYSYSTRSDTNVEDGLALPQLQVPNGSDELHATTTSGGGNPQDTQQEQDDEQSDAEVLPLLNEAGNAATRSISASTAAHPPPVKPSFRSRKGGAMNTSPRRKRRRNRDGTLSDGQQQQQQQPLSDSLTLQQQNTCLRICLGWCCKSSGAVRSTLNCMNVVARIVLWLTFVSLAAAVIWYSYELIHHG